MWFVFKTEPVSLRRVPRFAFHPGPDPTSCVPSRRADPCQGLDESHVCGNTSRRDETATQRKWQGKLLDPQTADRRPLSRLMGGSQTAGCPDGRIANCWAPGWADRKPLGCRMGQTQTGASSDGRNANRWAPGWSKRKPWDVHKGGTQTDEPGANSQTQTQTTTRRKRSANRRRQGANASANFEPRFCSLRTRFEAVCAHAWTGVAGFGTAAEPMITN